MLLRLGPERHEAVKKAAESAGLSVNDWLLAQVERGLGGDVMPARTAFKAALEEVARTAAALAGGAVLVPGAEVPGSDWEALLGGDGK